MNNVLKFDPSQKRKPEPEAKKPQNDAARFVWISAIVGPLGSALFLMAIYGFSDIWAVMTNPTDGALWGRIGIGVSFVLLLGGSAVPFCLVALAPYSIAVNKGVVLLRSIFVRRAMAGGAVYGVAAAGLMSFLLGEGSSIQSMGFVILSVALAAVLGAAISFMWAHTCWILGGEKLSPTTNDNR
ncbi:hypothetical protein [Maritalea sp.]|uniref:hypothetical protein n=1 Tax=Maritalea sp. TaxID=2003361 RepID=UPI0039E2B293